MTSTSHTPFSASTEPAAPTPAVDRDRRTTFLSVRTLLDRAQDALEALGDRIEQDAAETPNEATRERLRALDAERRRILEDTLARVAREAPGAALDRMVQYGASLPPIDGRQDDAIEVDVFERSARRMIEWSDALAHAFERLAAAETAHAPLHDALRFRLIAHARRISRVLAEHREAWGAPPAPPQTSSSA